MMLQDDDTLVEMLSFLSARDRNRLSTCSRHMLQRTRAFRSVWDVFCVPLTDPSRHADGPWTVDGAQRVARLARESLPFPDCDTARTLQSMLSAAGEAEASRLLIMNRKSDCITIDRNTDYRSPVTNKVMMWCARNLKTNSRMRLMSVPLGPRDLIDTLTQRCAWLHVCGTALETNTRGGVAQLDSYTLAVGSLMALHGHAMVTLRIDNYTFTERDDVTSMCAYLKGSATLTTLAFRNVGFTRGAWAVEVMDSAGRNTTLTDVSMVNTMATTHSLLSTRRILAASMKMCENAHHVELDYADIMMDDDDDLIENETECLVQTVTMRRLGISSAMVASLMGCCTFTNMYRLDLSYNRIMWFPEDLATSCPNLDTLRLRANMLTNESVHALTVTLQQLETMVLLDVSDNMLTSACLSSIMNTSISIVIADANSIRCTTGHILTVTNRSYVERRVSLRGNPITTTPSDPVHAELLSLRNVRLVLT
jgi:hypothetical protein